MRLTPASSDCSIHLPRENYRTKPKPQRERRHHRHPSHAVNQYGTDFMPPFGGGKLMIADDFVSIGELNHRERQERRTKQSANEYWNVPRRTEYRTSPRTDDYRVSPRVRKHRRTYDNRAFVHMPKVIDQPIYDDLPAVTKPRRIKKSKSKRTLDDSMSSASESTVVSRRRLITETSAYLCYAGAFFSMVFYIAGIVYNGWALVTHDSNAFVGDYVEIKYWKATWVFDLCLYAVGIVAVACMMIGILKIRAKLLVFWMLHGAFVTIKHIVQMVIVLTYSTTQIAVIVSSIQLGGVLILVIFLYVIGSKMEQYGRLKQVGHQQYVKFKRTTNLTDDTIPSSKGESYSPTNQHRPLLAVTDGSAISGSINSGAMVPYSPPSVLRRDGAKHAGQTMQVAVSGGKSKKDRQYVSVIPVDCIPGFDPMRMTFRPQNNEQQPVFIPVYYQ